MTRSTVEILREARSLIDTPDKWAQEDIARNARGELVGASDPSACQFCTLGAVMHVTGAEFAEQGDAWDATAALREAMGEWPAEFNDSHSHADVLAAFDRAIELAEVSDAG